MAYLNLLNMKDPKVRLKAAEWKGGPGKGRLAGGWIADMAALKKAVLLCDFCVRRWAPRNYGYRRRNLWPGQSFAFARCDGCGRTQQCFMHLHEGDSTYESFRAP